MFRTKKPLAGQRPDPTETPATDPPVHESGSFTGILGSEAPLAGYVFPRPSASGVLATFDRRPGMSMRPWMGAVTRHFSGS
jgi:hypothetical protein